MNAPHDKAATALSAPSPQALDVARTLAQAVALHQQGRIAEAEPLYHAILAHQPQHFDALHLLGVVRLQHSQFEEAAALIERALAINPNSADALLNRGNALQALGRHELAVACYEKATALRPRFAEAFNNRGNALQALKRPLEALVCFDEAQAINPRFAEALHNRGVTLSALRRHAEAAANFQQALALRPNYPEAWHNLGRAASAAGDRETAIECFGKALALRPEFFEALSDRAALLAALNRNEDALTACEAALALKALDPDLLYLRGRMLQAMQRFDEAMSSYDLALAVRPEFPEALNNRGAAQMAFRRYAEALADFDKAAAQRPDYLAALRNRAAALEGLRRHAEAVAACDRILSTAPHDAKTWSNRGASLDSLGRHDDALSSYDWALALDPDLAEVWSNRGVTLEAFHRFGEALAHFARAQALNPNHAQAHFHESLTRLLLGDYEEGWKKYEWRWRTAAYAAIKRETAKPLWLGQEDLSGKTIYLHAEQGYGDTIQFVRYAPFVAAKGATVLLKVPEALEALCDSVWPRTKLVRHGEILPSYDFNCPLLSLPLALGTTLETIPATVPYLEMSRDRVAEWAARFEAGARLRVGLAWSGNPEKKTDRLRSIAFAALSPLLSLPGIEFVSLQKEIRNHDAEALEASPAVARWGEEFSDFSDAAAVISLLDLVISVDTAAAHLAGALARPVWILLPFCPDWRWMLEREDSPWYPSARLFRQPRFGDWPAVVGRVRQELERYAERRN